MAKKTGTATQAATSGVTKQEAVRRALAALGKTTTASAIQKYVKDTFNLDMSIDHIYTAKSSAVAKGKKKAKKLKVALLALPEPTAADASVTLPPTPRQPAGSISLQDIEAVKALLGRIGADNLIALADLLAG